LKTSHQTLPLLSFSVRRSIKIALSSLGFLVWLSSSTQAQPTAFCPAQLNEKIEAITNRPQFRHARWGILVQTQGITAQRQTLYAQDADRYFVPASNAKLLTTAAALTQLGPQFRIRTSVYEVDSPSDSPPGGVTLQVVGRGDPSFTDAELRKLAQQIRDRHITQIDRLIGNDQYFRGDAVNPSWEWEDVQSGYGAPANSLILNQNLIGLTLWPQQVGQPLRVQWDDPIEAGQWRVDNRSQTVAAAAPEFVEVGRDLSQPILSVRGQLQVGSASEPTAIAIPQPAQHFLQRFQQVLIEAQIRVMQTSIASTSMPQGLEVAAIESPPLTDLLVETNQESNNLYAEAVLRSLGVNQSPLADSSSEAGLTALKAVLARLGVDPGSYVLSDGSGLSRRNLVSPEAIVQTLQAMAQSPYATVYRSSLSVAGISGTLQNRFRDTPVQGRLQGKSGSLSGTAALSGYLASVEGSPLIFCILVNQSNLSLSQIQEGIDAIVGLLVQLHPC
jgi:serine-type D-Ala-D-Ala carboxypeptidase/endopeptidase (penicillin-binding protein 4)